MQRPVGVTVITIFFLVAAVYFWIAGAAILIAPTTTPPMTGLMLRRALKLTGPYPVIVVGGGYALIGWGLFRLHNWARA